MSKFLLLTRRNISRSISPKLYCGNAGIINLSYRNNYPSSSLNAFVIRRNFSDSSPDANKIVSKSIENSIDCIPSSNLDLAVNNPIVSIATESLPQHSNFAIQTIMNLIDQIHLITGVPYWEAIVAATIALRIVLFPVALKTIQSSARMAVMRPEMQKIQDIMNSNPNQMSDPKMQIKYQNQMKSLFVKYKVNPFRAMLWPFFQFPIFIGCFLALKDMGNYFPGFKQGGDFWFTDLSGADPYLILPILNSLSFLIMIEIGGDGIQVNQMQTFRTVMRGMAVVMIPLTMSMPQGLFVYWCTNNVLSIGQTFILKQETLRNYFDIPKPPADANTPALKIVNPMTAISQAIEKERSKGMNSKAEILDEIVKTPPINIKVPTDPPKITFVQSPKRGKKETNEK